MLSLATSSFAFSAPTVVPRATLSMAAIEPEMPQVPETPVPLISTIRVGDNKLAGDASFDPLQLAETSEKLAYFREAEVKHARLAMLAAAGWPLAELLNEPLGNAVGLPSVLAAGGRAPSVLNGGLGSVSAVYWAGILGLAIFVESKSLDQQLNIGKREQDYLPGMMGLDPLKMDTQQMRGAEIINGRLAMIAITAFVLEEAIFGQAVVRNTPFFFTPIWS